MNTKVLAAACTAVALLAGCGADGASPRAVADPSTPSTSEVPAPAGTSATAAVSTAPAPGSLTPTMTPTTAGALASVGAGGSRATVAGVKLAAGTVRTLGTTAVRYPTGYPVSPNFFGMHDGSPVGGVDGWPQTSVGTIRLWDAGVTWRNIETAPGRYDFTRLDAIVRQANLKHAETLIVLGQTPTFYASRQLRTDVYGPGAASMPTNLNAWRRYVAAVANRPGVRGNRYVQFQVWNEANVREFWNGSPGQMALLTKLARDTLGKTRYLVAPAMVTRNSLQRKWMDLFYASRLGRYRVADYVNAVSLQLYPVAPGTPEDSMQLLALDRKILAKYRVVKPIWNTEINYGLVGHTTAAISEPRQAANVSRTFLLNASAGVKRTYWYAWGRMNVANTRLTTSNGYTLTRAGRAYGLTRSWLVSSQVRSCARNVQGTYTCTITYRGGVRRVFWNPTRSVVVAVAGATTHQLLDGTLRQYSSRTIRLKVGYSPVMIRSAR